MWPFKEKINAGKIWEFKLPEIKPPEWKDDWERILIRFPIGCEFNFCGRKMLVAKTDYDFRMGGWSDPLLCAYYLDENGVIQEFNFGPKFFQLLLKTELISTPEVPE